MKEAFIAEYHVPPYLYANNYLPLGIRLHIYNDTADFIKITIDRIIPPEVADCDNLETSG